MAKPRASKKTKSTTSANLIAALEFVSVAQKAEGTFQAHCQINRGQVIASDGILTAGHKIDEDLVAMPHTFKFIAALERCGKDLAITQMDGKLSVKSGPFSGVVDCMTDLPPSFAPDPPAASISDTIRTGFESIAHLSVENAKTVVLSSILIRSGSMCSTDGFLILEYWHGYSLPTIVIPKSFVAAIINVKKPLKSFGFSDRSCTFWFEDDSWIKTQLYEEPWPDVDRILNMPSNPVALPENFFEAVAAIESFSDGKRGEKKVFFGEGCLQSHRDKAEGACYEVSGLPFGPCFGIERLKRIKNVVKSVDFLTSPCYIFGDAIRGALMGIRKE
jgi:hypothetical protein